MPVVSMMKFQTQLATFIPLPLLTNWLYSTNGNTSSVTILQLGDGQFSYGSLSMLQLDVFDDGRSETTLIVASSVRSSLV